MRSILSLLIFAPGMALSQSIAVLNGDFDGDGISDRAELFHSVSEIDMADLLINSGSDLGAETTAIGIVWVGGPGQIPELHQNQAGSLVVRSMNIGFGRNKWQQDLTIAWREESFVLAGFTYEWYDSLDLSDSGTCDLNLLTGWTEFTSGDPLTVTRHRTDWVSVPISEWVPSYPNECGLGE